MRGLEVAYVVDHVCGFIFMFDSILDGDLIEIVYTGL